MESPLCPPADPDFRLIETFGYHPGHGCPRLKRHLARMARSARALGLAFDKAGAAVIAQQISGDKPLRCRLTLDAAGALELTTVDLVPTRGPWRLGIAATPLDSRNPWLRHKTTQRQLYDRARAMLPDGLEELIFLNERGEVCEGTITSIFVHLHGGRHVTPPLSSGVLPGVLRQAKLDKGEVEERIVTLDELRRARWISVGNSLRGEMAADLVWPPEKAAFRSAGLTRG